MVANRDVRDVVGVRSAYGGDDGGATFDPGRDPGGEDALVAGMGGVVGGTVQVADADVLKLVTMASHMAG